MAGGGSQGEMGGRMARKVGAEKMEIFKMTKVVADLPKAFNAQLSAHRSAWSGGPRCTAYPFGLVGADLSAVAFAAVRHLGLCSVLLDLGPC